MVGEEAQDRPPHEASSPPSRCVQSRDGMPRTELGERVMVHGVDDYEGGSVESPKTQLQYLDMRPLRASAARWQSSIDTHSVPVISAPKARLPGPNMIVGIPTEHP